MPKKQKSKFNGRQRPFNKFDDWKSSVSEEVTKHAKLFQNTIHHPSEVDLDRKLNKIYDGAIFNTDDIGDHERRKYFETLKANMPMLAKELKSKLYNNWRDRLKITIVTEKPSISKRIAHACAFKNQYKISKWNGFVTYTFQQMFQGILADFNVISTYGHIYDTQFNINVDIFNENPVDVLCSLPLHRFYVSRYYEKVKVTEAQEGYLIYGRNYKKFEEFLAYYLCRSDVVVLWLDNDQSGDATSQQVIDLIKFYCKMDERFIFRAEFSSLAKTDILKSFQNISSYNNEMSALAHRTKSEIDLRVGLAITVLQSNILRSIVPKHLNVNDKFSYGPCLFPTLFFCVHRVYQMLMFTPKKYWRIVKTIVDSEGNEIEVESVKKYDTFEDAQAAAQSVNGYAILTNKTIKLNEINKPEPLNTTKMLIACSQTLGMDSTQTSRIAQNLYEEGYVSYPRSEGKKYTSEMVESFKLTLQ